MNNIVKEIKGFIDNTLTLSKNIDIDELLQDKIESYISNETESLQRRLDRTIGKIESASGFIFPESYYYLFFLQDQRLKWNRPEQETSEGNISGGFYFNGMRDIFICPVNFWEYPTADFSIAGCETLADIPKNISWFESRVAHNDSEYCPHYGGVLLDSGTFPTKFYFYDSGFLYLLPFSTFEEYFSAMIASAGVTCWQLFYVNPEEIISRNKGVSYFTWSLHKDSCLDESLKGVEYQQSAKYDRLDLINEYLKRCVTLLPESFPFQNFSSHQQYYEKFSNLYQAGI